MFYGAVCFAGMFILWRCLLRLSGRPTAHNKRHFSPYWKKKQPFSLSFSHFFFFFFCQNLSPRALEAALLPHGPPVMFICSSTSLWFLWSLFLLRICLCLAGPRTFKMMKGGGRKMSGKAIFYSLWCVYGYCSPFVISSQQPDGEKSEENLNKSDKLAWVTPPPTTTCTSDWHWECVV